MKKIKYIYLFLLMQVFASGVNAQTEKIVVAYVTSWTSVIPNVEYITHINYAFGHVNDTFDGVRIDNEDRLRRLVELKKQKPELKILLSVGGWGSGRFSEMATDPENRKRFASGCKRIVESFDLDGIDIDWEYPTADMAGISASPDDKENFSLLIKDLRKAIGKKKTLTLATSANAQYYNFRDFVKYVDFVNMMTYDMGAPPYHHSALYPSEFTHNSGDESVQAHINAGVPAEKLVYGIPFYGRGNRQQIRFINYRDIIQNKDFTEKWDDAAQVPYLVNDSDETICVFDNSRSITVKCNYIIEKQLCGAMYWDYAGDDDAGTLSETIWKILNKINN
jgi:chitinase